MKVTASSNYVRISPRKVRTVVDVVRGMGARDAEAQLSFLSKRAAEPVRKLIASAIANAQHNFSLDPSSLKIVTIKVDEGPRLKRFKAKGMGRASLIEKKTSHLTLVLEGERMKEDTKKTTKKEKAEVLPSTSPQDVSSTETEEKDFTLRQTEKKIGKQKKDSFTKRFFQRKSI